MSTNEDKIRRKVKNLQKELDNTPREDKKTIFEISNEIARIKREYRGLWL